VLLVDSSVWIDYFYTVRKTIDCFIATYAIAYRHELLYRDAEFDPFEAHLGPRVIHSGRLSIADWRANLPY